MMTIYIAGPMTGMPGCNRVAFDRAEHKLEGLGYTPMNPAWLSERLPKKCYLPICMEMIDQSDGMVLLPGWEQSKGAQVERAYAEYNGKPVWLLEELIGGDGA